MAYICTLKEFKRQYKPGPGDEGDVEEANEVSQQSRDQHLQISFLLLLSCFSLFVHLYMTIFGDGLEAVEICAHLWDMVDHRSDAENGWMSTIVLHINKSKFQQMLNAKVNSAPRSCLCWEIHSLFDFLKSLLDLESELHVSRIQSQSSLCCQDGFPIEN